MIAVALVVIVMYEDALGSVLDTCDRLWSADFFFIVFVPTIDSQSLLWMKIFELIFMKFERSMESGLWFVKVVKGANAFYKMYLQIFPYYCV